MSILVCGGAGYIGSHAVSYTHLDVYKRQIEGILTDAFSGIQYRIENLLRRNGIHLDESQAYRVMLVEFEDRSVSEMEVDFKGSLAQLAHRYTDVILCPLTWNGRGLVIMPDVDRIADQALCEHAKVMQDLLHDWQQDFSKRHQVRLDCGLGDLHVLPEIQELSGGAPGAVLRPDEA